MNKVFETTCEGRNYDVIWEDTIHGPRISMILHHNTEVAAHLSKALRDKLSDALAEHIVKSALKITK